MTEESLVYSSISFVVGLVVGGIGLLLLGDDRHHKRFRYTMYTVLALFCGIPMLKLLVAMVLA